MFNIFDDTLAHLRKMLYTLLVVYFSAYMYIFESLERFHSSSNLMYISVIACTSLRFYMKQESLARGP